MAPGDDHPTQTLSLTRTRTLWSALCLDAVACEGSRLIRPKGDAADGVWVRIPKLAHPGVHTCLLYTSDAADE